MSSELQDCCQQQTELQDVSPLMMRASALIPGRSLYDMNPTNIQDYCCGSFLLVERDLRLVLEPEVAQSVIDTVESDLRSAFRLREELINMKKVAYHIQKSGNAIERSLAQLATFFREDVSSPESVDMQCWVHSDRLTAISETRMRCKGACAAISDARALAKNICCVPRHPSKGRPSKLAGMPQNLETAGRVREATAMLSANPSASTSVVAEAEAGCNMESTRNEENVASFVDPDTDTADVAKDIGKRSGDDCGEKIWVVTGVGTGIVEEDSSNSISTSTTGDGIWYHRVMAALQALAAASPSQLCPPVLEFVKLVLICRGADKALRIVDEVLEARLGVRATIADILAVQPLLHERGVMLEAKVQGLLGDGSRLVADPTLQLEVGEMRSRGIFVLKYTNLLRGALPQLQAVSGWLDAIVEVAERHSQQVVFLAGDIKEGQSLPAALNLPSNEATTESVGLFATYRAVEARYRPEMRAAIVNNGWPAYIDPGVPVPVEEAKKCPENKLCRECRRRFTVLWVHLGVCCECEDRVRTEERRCPYRAACKSSWFCLHALKCLICDAHSCDLCQLHRGDAEIAIEIANRLRPRRVALDFDRTVSSTRSGAPPVLGKHVADVDLISLMWEHPCVIVTRNQNKTEIRSFLVSQGAPEGIQICTVAKKESKIPYVMGHHLATNTGSGTGSDSDSGIDSGSAVTAVNGSSSNTSKNAKDNRSDAVLFVDDSIQELVDEFSLEDNTNLHRILFVRGLA